MMRGMATIGLSQADTIIVRGLRKVTENRIRRKIETKDIKLNTNILSPSLKPRKGMMRDSMVASTTLSVKIMIGTPFNSRPSDHR